MKYQVFYVYETKVESGGRMWKPLHNMICASIGFMQLMTIAVLYLVGEKQNLGPIVLVSFLPFVTLTFWIYMKRIWGPRSIFVPYTVNAGDNSHAYPAGYDLAQIEDA